jgi:hypothetical protein
MLAGLQRSRKMIVGGRATASITPVHYLVQAANPPGRRLFGSSFDLPLLMFFLRASYIGGAGNKRERYGDHIGHF